MDDDFDEYYPVKPKYRLVSATPEEESEDDTTPSKPLIYVCSGVATALAAFAVVTTGFLQFVLIWISLALYVGPHAPPSVTGGDCRVNVGDLLEEEVNEAELQGIKPSKSSRTNQKRTNSLPEIADLVKPSKEKEDVSSQSETSKEWSAEEVQQLHRAIWKYRKGTPRRWEVIAQALGWVKSTEEVVKMGQQLENSKSKDLGSVDAYATFLAQRKKPEVGEQPMDPTSRFEVDGKPLEHAASGNGVCDENWTEDEDRILVQAMREFPKDTVARWDKVAEGLPNKSKQQCHKRFSELKQLYRSGRKQDTSGET